MHFAPAFIQKLNETPWLFDDRMNAATPQGFPMERFHVSFHQAKPESLWMAEELGMITQNVSADEKEILSLIRKHNLDAGSLQQLLDGDKREVVFYQYLPLSETAPAAGNALNFSMADLKAIIQSNPFASNNSQSWDQCLFEEKTQILKNHFLNSIL